MRFLFLVALGPVQDFIASARRTRDLHFGSWLLSELSRTAAHKIHALNGNLIFPAPKNMESLQPNHPFNVANRILALIEQEPGTLAADIQTAVNRRLYEIRDRAYKDVALFGKEKTTAYLQIEKLIEFVWVALPLPNVQDYHTVRNQLEALMAARKNSHAFGPVEWGANVPKSSIDGQLESVIPEDDYPRRTASADEKRLAIERLYRRYGVAGPAERLSGVDLLKRAGKTAFDAHFPSTSHFAILPFLKRMKRIDANKIPKLRDAWEMYIKQLGALALVPLKEQITHTYQAHPILGHHDGSLLFEGRLSDILLLPATDKPFDDRLKQAREAQQTFYEELNDAFSSSDVIKKRPSTYYALLQADGDNMGDLIDALALAENGYEQHRVLSQALSSFAEDIRTIVVDDNEGALVYSGGDDVLAFLPLHTVLKCAGELRTRFHNALSKPANQVGLRPPTLSVGIAIAHHLDSLREVRRIAHDAEQQAKRQDGKNALAITVSKRSGEDYHIVGSWGNIDVRLSELVSYCRDASLPAGTAYELRDMALRLSVPRTDPQYDDLQQVIRVDTLRILLRKLTMPAGKLSAEQAKKVEAFLRTQLALPPKELEEQKNSLPDPTRRSDQQETQEVAHPHVSVEMFIHELVIAQMLAEAAELALV